MNGNLVRTGLYLLSILAMLLPIFFGCTALATGSFDCSMSWVGPVWSGGLAIVLMLIALAVKQFAGEGLVDTTSGTFRTVLTVLGVIVTGAVVFLGCTNMGTGLSCANSWIGPFWGGIAGSVLLGLNLIVKKFDGTTLTKPTV